MGKVLLCALVLLLSLGAACVKKKGELCRAWIYGVELTSRVFYCPTYPDRADAKFCCGTCKWSYCCSWREGRINQAQCSAEMKASRRTLQGRKQVEEGFLSFIWFGISAIATLILCIWACACGYKAWKCLILNWGLLRARFCHDQLQQMELEVQRPHLVPPVVGPPIPYANYRSTEPPPYRADPWVDPWVVQFHPASQENPEDEVDFLSPPPLSRRTDLVCTVEPTRAGEEMPGEGEVIVEPTLEEEVEGTLL